MEVDVMPDSDMRVLVLPYSLMFEVALCLKAAEGLQRVHGPLGGYA